MGIPVIERAKLQAQVLVPLVKALQAELGEERANALVRKALADVYRRLGEQWWRVKQSRHVGENMTLAFASFAKGDALDYSVRAQSEDTFEIDVTAWPRGLRGRGGVGPIHQAHAHTNHHASREPL